MMKFVATLLFIIWQTIAWSQELVPTYSIGLILPFDEEQTEKQLTAFEHAVDLSTASRIKLSEDAQTSLDFFQGMVHALNTSSEAMDFQLYVYDNNNDDSVTRELLKLKDLKELDVIIGSVSPVSAKLIADFCNKNHIINIQPFTPSKSLTQLNPYHLKLAPLIDSHIDALFQSAVDSFAGANVIVYSPSGSGSLGIAKRLDSLFKEYNRTAPLKFSVAMLNTKDMMLNGKKTTVKEQLKPGKANLLFVNSFEESFVNGTLRVLFDSKDEFNIVVFGMPNWLNGDVLRLDYLSEYHTRISSPFYADTLKMQTVEFITDFNNENGVAPSPAAFLGYDVMNFLQQSLRDYGKEFLGFVATQRYKGTGYTFDIATNTKTLPASAATAQSVTELVTKDAINYYENCHVNVFMVQDYRLIKIR